MYFLPRSDSDSSQIFVVTVSHLCGIGRCHWPCRAAMRLCLLLALPITIHCGHDPSHEGLPSCDRIAVCDSATLMCHCALHTRRLRSFSHRPSAAITLEWIGSLSPQGVPQQDAAQASRIALPAAALPRVNAILWGQWCTQVAAVGSMHLVNSETGKPRAHRHEMHWRARCLG